MATTSCKFMAEQNDKMYDFESGKGLLVLIMSYYFHNTDKS